MNDTSGAGPPPSGSRWRSERPPAEPALSEPQKAIVRWSTVRNLLHNLDDRDQVLLALERRARDDPVAASAFAEARRGELQQRVELLQSLLPPEPVLPQEYVDRLAARVRALLGKQDAGADDDQ